MDLHPGEEIVFEGHPSWRGRPQLLRLRHRRGRDRRHRDRRRAARPRSARSSPSSGIVVVVLVGFLRRIGTHYVVTSQRLRIRRGILAKSIQQTRIDRVQNVNTDQRLLDRILRVGTVDFDTAGTDDSDFTFRGIADPDEVVAAVDRAQRIAGRARGRAVRTPGSSPPDPGVPTPNRCRGPEPLKGGESFPWATRQRSATRRRLGGRVRGDDRPAVGIAPPPTRPAVE